MSFPSRAAAAAALVIAACGGTDLPTPSPNCKAVLSGAVSGAVSCSTVATNAGGKTTVAFGLQGTPGNVQDFGFSIDVSTSPTLAKAAYTRANTMAASGSLTDSRQLQFVEDAQRGNFNLMLNSVSDPAKTSSGIAWTVHGTLDVDLVQDTLATDGGTPGDAGTPDAGSVHASATF